MPATSAATKPTPLRTAHEFTVDDVEYLSHGGSPLLLRLFKPKGAGPFPLMIDLHGGAWCGQDRTSDAMFNEALAKSGVVVAALDWRMPPVAGYPASLADINYATRWLKARAGELKARADRVGMIGISSGGHLAMLAAMRPRDKRYAAIPLAGRAGLDATVAAVAMIWPVIDPLRRFHHAKRLQAAGGKYPEQIDRVIPLHTKFWGTEEAMEEGNPSASWTVARPSRCRPFSMCRGPTTSCIPRSISSASWQATGNAAARSISRSTRVKAGASSAIRPPRPLRTPCSASSTSCTRVLAEAKGQIRDGGRWSSANSVL